MDEDDLVEDPFRNLPQNRLYKSNPNQKGVGP